MSLQPANILKVCDIYPNQILPETLKFIEGLEPEYRDNRLSEHLYGIDEIANIASDEGEDLPENVQKQIDQLYEMLAANDCGYIRICEI